MGPAPIIKTDLISICFGIKIFSLIHKTISVQEFIIITLFNKGADDISNCPIDLRIDGDVIDSWRISLVEGEFYNITGEYTWYEQQPSVAGHADFAKEIEELDDSNNVNSVLINVAAPEYDLTLVSVDSVDTIFRGDNVEMIVQIPVSYTHLRAHET